MHKKLEPDVTGWEEESLKLLSGWSRKSLVLLGKVLTNNLFSYLLNMSLYTDGASCATRDGFCPVWTLMCLFKVPCCVNPLPQSLQANGFSPV